MDFEIFTVVVLAGAFCPPQFDRAIRQGQDGGGVIRGQLEQFAALGYVTVLFDGFACDQAGLGKKVVAEKQMTVGKNLRRPTGAGLHGDGADINQ